MSDPVNVRNIKKLSEDAAAKLLANVMDTCGMRPVSIPLSSVTTYSEYRRERYTFQIIILVIVLTAFLVLPLFFISPEVSIYPSGTDKGYTVYSVTVDHGIIPVTSVSATIDGNGVNAVETDSRTYSLTPLQNGTLSVCVTLLNRQNKTVTLELGDVDRTGPVLIDGYRDEENEQLILYVQDEGVGLDYPEVAAYTMSGERIPPHSINTVSGEVIFDFPEESVTISIPDKNGNTLEIIVTVTKGNPE